MGLRRLLAESGIDIERDNVKIAPVPGSQGSGINFGVTAARALEEGKIDGFWANGMGAEVAVRRGVGTIVVDVRRGDAPKAAFDFTFSAVATRDDLIAESPAIAVAAIRAIVATQKALKIEPDLATKVGSRLFPAYEAQLIAELIRRDLPYYDPAIKRSTVDGLNHFARDVGILKSNPPYEQVVAERFSNYWTD